MKDLNLNGGDIFAIPLFIPYDTDEKRFSEKFHKESQGDYVFCRIISEEMAKSYMIEVFNKVGSLDTSLDEIVKAPRLFKPIPITTMGIRKKRWIKVYQQESYDKERESNYSEIQLVIGDISGLQLWQNGKTTPITQEEAQHYEFFRFWFASHLEKRIREILKIKEP